MLTRSDDGGVSFSTAAKSAISSSVRTSPLGDYNGQTPVLTETPNLPEFSNLQRSLPSSSSSLAASSTSILSTITANPLPYHERQPDGTSTPPLYFRGNGQESYVSDHEGYVVMRDEGGWYVYAEEVVVDGNDHSDDDAVDQSRQSPLRQRHRRLDRLNVRSEQGSKQLKPGKHRLGTVDPATVPGSTTLPPRRSQASQLRQQHRTLTSITTGQKVRNSDREDVQHPSRGKFLSLILLVRFADHLDRDLPTKQQLMELYNRQDHPHDGTLDDYIHGTDDSHVAPTGSIRQLFLQNSYGLLDSHAYVVDWITLSGTESEYANGDYGFTKFREAITEALDRLATDDAMLSRLGLDADALDVAATSTIANISNNTNGTMFHGLGILHSGYGAEYGGPDCFNKTNENRIWSHQAGSLGWVHPHARTNGRVNGTTITIDDKGKHPAVFQVPNEYYVASALRNKCGSDIVRIGIIAHEIGHQLGLPDLYDKTWNGNGIGNYDPMSRCWGWDGTGLYPPVFSAWSKMSLGWLKPMEITTSGRYWLGPSVKVPQAYVVKKGYPEGEYLLIENRQPLGLDTQC